MKKILITILVFLAITTLIPQFIPAFAQQVSLRVDPPLMQITANVPTSIQAPFSIENTSDSPIELAISFKPFSASPLKNGQIQFEGSVNGNDPNIFDKMQIYEGSGVVSTITLAPSQKKDLMLHIGLPKDEPPSDYYFTILFLSKEQDLKSQTATAAQAGIGINVLLSVGQTGNATGLLDEFSTPWFVSQGPVVFTTLIENTSDFFIAPKGNIVIKNLFGQAVGKVNLLPVNVLSHSQRFIPDDTSNSLTKAIWPEKVLFGLYQATLTVALTNQGPLFTRTVYFFALPIQAILGIIVVCLVAAFVYMRIRQKLKEK